MLTFSDEDLSSTQTSTDLASPLKIDFSDEDDADYLYSTSNPRRSKRNLKNLKNQKLKFEEPALHPTRRRHASAAPRGVTRYRDNFEIFGGQIC